MIMIHKLMNLIQGTEYDRNEKIEQITSES